MAINMNIRKAQWIQLGIDFGLCLLVGIPFLAVYLTVSPFVRGFFCHDESIMYPYHPDTVSIGLCTGVGIGVAIISFLGVELGLAGKCIKQRWKEIIWQLAKLIITFMVGAGLTMVLVEVGKLTVGRPRPHFFDVCRPDYSKINCSKGYIEEFVCTNTGGFPDKVLSEVRKSFPSGHSGFSAYTALFLGIYFQVRLRHLTQTYLLKVVLQLIMAIGAFYIILSRISDYKHHWSDVLVGGIVGFLVAVWTVLSLGQHLNFFETRRGVTYWKENNSVQYDVEGALKRVSALDDAMEANSSPHTAMRSSRHDSYGST